MFFLDKIDFHTFSSISLRIWRAKLFFNLIFFVFSFLDERDPKAIEWKYCRRDMVCLTEQKKKILFLVSRFIVQQITFTAFMLTNNSFHGVEKRSTQQLLAFYLQMSRNKLHMQ